MKRYRIRAETNSGFGSDWKTHYLDCRYGASWNQVGELYVGTLARRVVKLLNDEHARSGKGRGKVST